jgi:hypothetical protein
MEMAYCPLRRLSEPVPHIEVDVTVKVNGCVAVAGAGVVESAISTVKVLVPVVVGIPVIAPELELRVSPEGRVPEARLHVTGSVADVWMY